MKKFTIDNTAILYLSLIRRHHTNIFRFSMTLTEKIDPELLQLAVNHVYQRFPTIFAGFRSGFFHCFQILSERPPQVAPDPGLLINMTKKEVADCACRVYYKENQIMLEGFHALTDGYGMIASLSTLVAEYLRLCHGIEIPVSYPVFDVDEMVKEEETEDAYLKYADSKPRHMPSRYSYQLPGYNPKCGPILQETIAISVDELLLAARKHGVSITALLSALMADSIMELQYSRKEKKLSPVRIMVPIDLRKVFPSKTLRNFILYALPTMEPFEIGCRIHDLAQKFSLQLKNHLHKDNLCGIIAYNVKTQTMPIFKLLPFAVKCILMRLVYRFFGESNSSLTMSNLGNIVLPEEMARHVESFMLTMMPRMRSPYNCGMYSYNGIFFINLCRFPESSRLEEIFARKLQQVLTDKEESI